MPTPHKIGPIARKLITRFRKSHQQKSVHLQAWLQPQDEFRALASDIATRPGGGPHPDAFKLYSFVQNWAIDMIGLMQELPELDPLISVVETAQDDYLPGYPPMSPVTPTFFWPWMLYDLRAKGNGETFAAILLSLGGEFNMDPVFLDVLGMLSESRLGLHVHEGWRDGRVLLRELVGGTLRCCDAGSNYEGAIGELWLARVLMPPMPDMPHALVINTPYVVQGADLAQWQAYLQRTLGETKTGDEQAAYSRLMKYGLFSNYWAEYVFEAYANYNANAVYILGLPDVDESRPHSSANN